MAHIDSFRFYGAEQMQSPAFITGILQSMKTNARYLRVRTFCQPDSVIAKQVIDALNFVNLLGTPEFLERPIKEVEQFFKAAVEKYKAENVAPAIRQGSARLTSKESRRLPSNGSGDQRGVRFQDEESERRRYEANNNKPRADPSNQKQGNSQTQIAQSQSDGHGLNLQRHRQNTDGANDPKSQVKAQGRSGHHHQ